MRRATEKASHLLRKIHIQYNVSSGLAGVFLPWKSLAIQINERQLKEIQYEFDREQILLKEIVFELCVTLKV